MKKINPNQTQKGAAMPRGRRPSSKSDSETEVSVTMSEEEVFGGRRSVGRSPPPGLKTFTQIKERLEAETGSGKRKRTEAHESVDDKLVQLRSLRDQLSSFLFTETNKVTHNAISFILKKWRQTEDLLVDTLVDLKVAKERPALPEIPKAPLVPVMSYASVAAKQADPMAKIRK